jgi:hypothetical protein
MLAFRFQLAFSLISVTSIAHAQNPVLDQILRNEVMDDQGSSGFLSPTGRFRFRVPSSFELEEHKDPDTLIFNGQVSGYPAKLIIRRISVTPGASSTQLLLTTRDRFLQRLPHFTVLKQGTAKIAGRLCATLIARYDYQGNKGYPQIIENGYVVDGGDGFIIHIEVQEAAYQYAAREIADIYKTFRTIPPPAAAPVAPPPQDLTKKSKKP